MKIKNLANVFQGSVIIYRLIINGHNVRFDELYDGKLAKLADEELLNSEIKLIENIPGSTLRNGVPFLHIKID